MVILGTRFTRRVLLSSLLTVFFSLMVAACAPTPRVAVSPGFRPAAQVETAYVVPFAAALVPETFSETVFNDFVDQLNLSRRETGVRTFAILREELKEVDPSWLSRQFSISGDIWSYVEDSGCCATNIRVKARVYVTEPGKSTPSVEIYVPLESFFDHDRSTIDRERDRLARALARDLAQRIVAAISSNR
ncbi:MAG: hypothetical protein ED859_13365 [Desulfuromonadales bacterium]|nr:MAG: hypothetical protein ED859_13365 [Desulfuromonadales bacterium]